MFLMTPRRVEWILRFSYVSIGFALLVIGFVVGRDTYRQPTPLIILTPHMEQLVTDDADRARLIEQVRRYWEQCPR